MIFRWLAVISFYFGLIIQAAVPVTLVGASTLGHPVSGAAPTYFKTGILSLQGRIWAQTQIERVYYNHRIWPKENSEPKPPFETMVPAAIITAKVNDSLKKSAALDKFWQHPVTGEMLQAELERMAKQTRDPAMLKELFEALHNDPRLIAETLARETLSDRLILNRYAYDTRIHDEAHTEAETIAARLSVSPDTDWKSLGGEYHHQIFVLDEHPNRLRVHTPANHERHVNSTEFDVLKNKYSRQTSGAAWMNISRQAEETNNNQDLWQGEHPTIHLNSTSASDHNFFQETPEHFILTRILTNTETRIEIEAITISKISFTQWWKSAALNIIPSMAIYPNEATQTRWNLPEVTAAGGCDAWGSIGHLYGAPLERNSHSAVWTGSEMIIWGGLSYNVYLSSGARYNPATDTWLPTSSSPNRPAARIAHTAVWTGTVMIVWGGSDISGVNFFNDGGRYNPNTDTWLSTSTGVNNPSPRSRHTAVWTGTEMIVWGGYFYNGTSTSYNTGGRYNPSINTWIYTSIVINTPTARAYHTAIWTGSEMIIWGGGMGWPFTNTGGRYSPATDSWLPTSVATNVPTAQSNHTSVWTGSVMIVWGSSINNGGKYNPTTDSWQPTAIDPNTPTVRNNNTTVWTGTEMIVWGGDTNCSLSCNYLNSGSRYNPATDSWQLTSIGENMPSARDWHTAVWTGSEMIIWGGVTNVAPYFLDTGGRYSPATDSWRLLSTSGFFPGRAYHTAVWTGSEMMIWGGNINGSDTNTGGRYNPISDSWLVSSTGANVPAARDGHTAIWTGSETIVWGGHDYSGIPMNTGGRYNPATNSWITTSLAANVPTARSLHTAVWTGGEMIVWGGGNYANTGGRYNPATDNWVATSVGVNVPVGRQAHTTVWTGTEMIVWGGDTYPNTGGRYNPTSDTWLSTSTGSNVPTGRSYHSAIWTGNSMIIWGGYDGTNVINSGARYMPATNSWLPTSTGVNLPWNRYYHTAVWTGSKMIIWGGTDSVSYHSDGGVYLYGPDSPGTSLRVVKSGTNINLAWGAESGATSYSVKRCIFTTTPCTASTIVASPATSSYSEPTSINRYMYSVDAVNACGITP